MRERAALVGASLEIESAPGQGTTVLVRIAVPAGASSDAIMAEKTNPLRILLADDHVTVRQGLKLLIDAEPDMEVVGEAERRQRGRSKGA